MAIKFVEHLEKKMQEDAAPLTELELGFITEVENHIDDIILKEVNTDRKRVSIFLHYANFTTRIGKSYPNNQYPSMTSARKKLLFDTLMERYSEAGWSYEVELDDSQSMNGSDYLILTGKK